MRPTAQIHEVAAMRFLEVNERFSRHELTCEQAAEVIGVSVSSFYRKRRRFAGQEGSNRLSAALTHLSAEVQGKFSSFDKAVPAFS